MGRLNDVPGGFRWGVCLAIVVGLGMYLACNSAPTPEAVLGPAVIGNMAPDLVITQPTDNFSIGQGGEFRITWTDSDRDSAAMISFSLVNTAAGASPKTVLLVEGIPENDSAAPDSVTVSTGFVPRGQYYLQATVTDGQNPAITTFATTPAPASTRVVVNVGEEDVTPANQPPTVYVTDPLVNLAVTLDDTIEIQIRPTADAPNENKPYDVDNSCQLFVSLDLDDDPQTGDPQSPDPEELIALLDTPITIAQGAYEPLENPIRISVDLTRFPLRNDGQPYFIRVTIDDGVNAPRDAYATGTINVTRVATGRVDLGQVGGTLSGARWLGFDPGAMLGYEMTSVTDFDDDGIDDCVLVSRFGVPTGRFPIGEAYLIYGMDKLRFGGQIDVNTVGSNVEGATFLGPQPRTSEETLGITSASYITDLTGDDRPELLFGMPFANGIRQHRDDDPGDWAEPAGEPRENVIVKIRQDSLTVIPLDAQGEEEDEPEFTSLAYDAVLDTTLDLNNPGDGTLATSDYITWGGTTVGEGQFTPSQWPIIQFNDLESFIPDFYSVGQSNLGIVSATLYISVGQRGANCAVHPLFSNFAPTLNAFSGGQAPVEDVHYNSDSVSGSGFQDVFTGENALDVTDTIEAIFENRQDLYGWIMIPEEGQSVIFYSSEVDTLSARPRLEIVYSRPVPGGGSSHDGCYPDLQPNNTSNRPTSTGSEDNLIAGLNNNESLGTVAMVASENRDSNYLYGPDEPEELELSARRLRRATSPLALAGQAPRQDGGGSHWAPAQGAVGEADGRLSGARWGVCIWDTVDDRRLNQGPVRANFGQRVAALPDIDNDQRPEIIISAPRNELDVEDLRSRFPLQATTCTEPLPNMNCQISHLESRPFWSNVIVYHGRNYAALREKSSGLTNAVWPHFDRTNILGSCTVPITARVIDNGTEYTALTIFGEEPEHELGDASSAGDFNLDGSPDILCGAPLADPPTGTDAGTTYIVYMRQNNQNQTIELANADFPSLRPPMLRIRGNKAGDRIGWAQESVMDINGDRINDIVIASPYTDAGGVVADGCSQDYNNSGGLDSADDAAFSACRAKFGEEDLCSDDPCAFFDYNNDRRIDSIDADVFAGGDCPVDNGVIAVVFGGIWLDGDRVVTQIGTTDLPGVRFYGADPGDRAGHDVASAGDFNRDGYGDLLITAPGATGLDDNGNVRVGVTYLIFGGPHLNNKVFNLADVGSDDLPGLLLLSPYGVGAPDEAPPQYVAGLGDLNNDGFDDIGIGNPLADFVDDTFPQAPGSGSDLTTGRRRDAGEIYLIYGHNITNSNP